VAKKIEAKKKILIVDDDRDMTQALEARLTKDGFAVHVATNGEALPDKCNRLRPSLVILDLNLPKRSGFLALQDLRGNVNTESIPVLVLTVRSETSSWERCYGLGAEGYFVKPFNMDELSKRIKKLAR
jgi:DNA-binding response OmpR family regulator